MNNEIARAAELLRAGRLVAFPTETVYGLGADAGNAAAVRSVFELKGRPAEHPLIVHLAQPEQQSADAYRKLLRDWASDVPDAAVALAAAFWPGPLTLLLHRAGHVHAAVTGGLDTVGLRVPAHPLALELLRQFAALQPGQPAGIAAPSANRFGHVSPTIARHVQEEFGGALVLMTALAGSSELPQGVSGAVLDGGACAVGIESTIVDLSADWPRILRPGGISTVQLAAVLDGFGGAREPDADLPRAPGMLPQHYAPQAELVLLEETELQQRLAELRQRRPPLPASALLASDDALAGIELPFGVMPLPLGATLEEQGRRLYAALREADAIAVEIYAVLPPPRGLGTAIRDRLHRAAGQGSLPESP